MVECELSFYFPVDALCSTWIRSECACVCHSPPFLLHIHPPISCGCVSACLARSTNETQETSKINKWYSKMHHQSTLMLAFSYITNVCGYMVFPSILAICLHMFLLRLYTRTKWATRMAWRVLQGELFLYLPFPFFHSAYACTKCVCVFKKENQKNREITK
jgi:hypothetical protein